MNLIEEALKSDKPKNLIEDAIASVSPDTTAMSEPETFGQGVMRGITDFPGDLAKGVVNMGKSILYPAGENFDIRHPIDTAGGFLGLGLSGIPGTPQSEQMGSAIVSGAKQAVQHPIDTAFSAVESARRNPLDVLMTLFGGGTGSLASKLSGIKKAEFAPLFKELRLPERVGGPVRTAYEAAKEGGPEYQAFKDAHGGLGKSGFDQQAWMKGIGDAVSPISQQVTDDYANHLMALSRESVSAATEGTRNAIRMALNEGVDPHQLWKSIEDKAHGLIDTSIMNKEVDVPAMMGKVREKAPFLEGKTQMEYLDNIKKIIQEEAFSAKPTDQKMQTLKMAMEPNGVSQAEVLENFKDGMDKIATAYSEGYQGRMGMLNEAEAAIASGQPIPGHIAELLKTLPEAKEGVPSWGNIQTAWDKFMKENRINIDAGSSGNAGKQAVIDRMMKPGSPTLEARKAEAMASGQVPIPSQSRVLNFKDSTIQLSPAQQAELQKLDDYLTQVKGSGPARITDLDAFKKSVGERANEVVSGVFNDYGLPAEKKALVEKSLMDLYGAVRQEANRGPLGSLYNAMTGDAEKAIRMRNETAKLLSLRGENSETIFNKLKDVVPDVGHPEYEFRRKVLSDIEKQSGYPITQKLDALNMQQDLKKLYSQVESAHDTFMKGNKYVPNPDELKLLDRVASNVLPEDQYIRLKGTFTGEMDLWKELQSQAISGGKGIENSAVKRLYELIINPTENGATRAFQEKMGKSFPELSGELRTLQGQGEVVKAQEGLNKTFNRPGPYTPGEIEGVARKTLPEGMQGDVRMQTQALRRQEKLSDVLSKSKGFSSDDVSTVRELAQEVLPASLFNRLESGHGFNEALLHTLKRLAIEGHIATENPAIQELGNILLSKTQSPSHTAITSALESSVPYARQTVAGRMLNPIMGGGFLPRRAESAATFGGPTSKISAVALFPFISPRFRGLMASGAGSAVRMGRGLPTIGRTLTSPMMTGARILSSRQLSQEEVRRRLLGK